MVFGSALTMALSVLVLVSLFRFIAKLELRFMVWGLGLGVSLGARFRVLPWFSFGVEV